MWGFARLFLFARSVLRSPSRGSRKKRYIVSTILLVCLHRWQAGDFVFLWEGLDGCFATTRQGLKKVPVQTKCQKSIFLAKEGRFIDALRSRNSHGCAQDDDDDAL